MHKSKKRAFATQGMIFTANNEARSKTTQIHCLRTRAFFSCLWMIRKVRIQWIFCAILTYWLVVLTIRVYHIYICILIVIFRVYVYLPEGNPIYVYIYTGWWCQSLWQIWVHQWKGLSHVLWKIKIVWNHQPAYQFVQKFIYQLKLQCCSLKYSHDKIAMSISDGLRTEGGKEGTQWTWKSAMIVWNPHKKIQEGPVK